MISTYPEQSLFLLSKGALPEQFKHHQGKLWECIGKCGKATNRRADITRDKRKCQHKILFDEDQPNGMGDNLKRDQHIPKNSCETASQPDAVREKNSSVYCLLIYQLQKI